MTREEAAKNYRIISSPSWQIQSMHRGKWVTIAYCGSEETAKASLYKKITRAIEWSKLTQEQRMAATAGDFESELSPPPGVAKPVLTQPQYDMLLAMAYVAAFLESYGRRVGMSVLETGLVLMVNDALRTAYVQKKLPPGRVRGRRHATLLDWMPLAVDQLLATQGIRIDPQSPEGLPFYLPGPSPFDLTGLPSLRAKAAEALLVMKQIGDEHS